MGNRTMVRKTVKIGRVVVAPTNIREFARMIYGHYSRERPTNDMLSVSFTALDANETQYDSDNPRLFDREGILDSKRIRSVLMAYTNHSREKGIQISLHHGDAKGARWNGATVWGPEDTWVTGNTEWVRNCVSDWATQPNLPRWLGWVLTLILAVILGETFLYFIGLFFEFLVPRVVTIQPLPLTPESRRLVQQSAEPLKHLCALFFGLYPAAVIAGKIRMLYPSVELAVGPDHLREEHTKRRRLSKLVTAVLLPVLAALLVEAATRFWG